MYKMLEFSWKALWSLIYTLHFLCCKWRRKKKRKSMALDKIITQYYQSGSADWLNWCVVWKEKTSTPGMCVYHIQYICIPVTGRSLQIYDSPSYLGASSVTICTAISYNLFRLLFRGFRLSFGWMVAIRPRYELPSAEVFVYLGFCVIGCLAKYSILSGPTCLAVLVGDQLSP